MTLTITFSYKIFRHMAFSKMDSWWVHYTILEKCCMLEFTLGMPNLHTIFPGELGWKGLRANFELRVSL